MRAQSVGYGQHHGFGAADKSGVHSRNINPVLEQKATFCSVYTPLEQLNILSLSFQNMQDGEPTHELVFQIFKLFFEHDRVHAPVSIDKREF